MQTYDYIVIGAGMAGASVGYELAPHGRVLVLERESQPGYHTTGRSAAQYAASYGNAPVRKLTVASRSFFDNPPAGFADHPLLTARGAIFVADKEQVAALEAVHADICALTPDVKMMPVADVVARVPIMQEDALAAAMDDPTSLDIDVHGLHQGYLRGLKQRGSTVVCDAEVEQIARQGDTWHVKTRAGDFSAPILINASGAWGDEVARLAGVDPVGLVPKRRTAITFDPPEGVNIDDWPLVVDAQESFYFKPDAGRLLASPADETPSPPCDAQPEELDVAILVDRLEQVTTLKPRRIAHKWAGLRTFAADKSPVCGFDPQQKGFFWLVGQGGYGIQMAPALARAAAALIAGGKLPDDITALGVRREDIAPDRPGLQERGR